MKNNYLAFLLLKVALLQLPTSKKKHIHVDISESVKRKSPFYGKILSWSENALHKSDFLAENRSTEKQNLGNDMNKVFNQLTFET